MIKVAEMLYNQIGDVQLSLVHSRLNNDEEGNSLAISNMEVTMCITQQFLNDLIYFNDNIVDLWEVWHSIDIEPQKGSWFMGQIGDNAYDTFIAEVEGKSMKDWLIGCNIKRWAYIKDLLPKEVLK